MASSSPRSERSRCPPSAMATGSQYDRTAGSSPGRSARNVTQLAGGSLWIPTWMDRGAGT